MATWMHAAVVVCAHAAAGGADPFAHEPRGDRPTGWQPSTGAASAVHIRLNGDLDAMRCVEELRERLDAAREERAALLVLEIGADRVRPDVLLAIADVVRESEIPTVGFLIDEQDRRVTPPALALAMIVGDRVAIDPDTAIRFERGDWRDDLLPDDAVPAEAIEELRMATQRALARREIDPTIVRAWLPEVDAAPSEPIEPRRLEAVGVDAVVADSVTRIARVAGHRGSVPRPVEIEGCIEPARAEVERLLRYADDAIETSRRALDLRNQRPDDREVTVHDHRRAGNEALDRLAVAAEGVARAEQVLREFPELLLAAPPGRTDVGSTRQTLRTAWRYRFDDLRDDLEYWRKRATDSASR